MMHEPGGLAEPLNPKGNNVDGGRNIDERLITDDRPRWNGMIDDDTREESFLLCVTFRLVMYNL